MTDNEKKMAEENSQQKLISLPETIIFMLFTIIAEIIEFFCSVTLLGIIISVVINIVVGSLTFIFLYFKGNSGMAKNKVQKRITRSLAIYLFGGIADTLTGGFLPIKAICLGVTIYMINHPKVDKLAEQAISVYLHPEQLASIVTGGVGKLFGITPTRERTGELTETQKEKVIEPSASGIRSRMAMSTASAQAKLTEVNRLAQASAQAKQSMSKNVPQGIPEDAM